jgi:hypothetical protein
LIVFGNPTYGTTDDYILSTFVSGEYTGNLERRLIFIQPLVGFIMNIFQKLFFQINIYSLFLLLLVILVFSIYLTIITLNNKLILINYSLVICLITWFTLRPTYTAASILLIMFSISTILMRIEQKSSKNSILLIILSLLLSIGILIRIESFIGVFIIAIPLICFILLKNKYIKIVNLGIVASIVFSLILINFLIIANVSNSNWQSYDKWNMIRHQVQHRYSENLILQNVVATGKWTPAEYHLFMDLAYADHAYFSDKWIKIAFDSTNSTRGIRGILNADIKFTLENLFSLAKNYYLILLGQIILLIYLLKSMQTKIKEKIIYTVICTFPTLISFYYMASTLHLPERVVLPITFSSVIFLMTLVNVFQIQLFKKNNLKIINNILPIIFSLLLIIDQKSFQRIFENKKLKLDAQTKISWLKELENSIFIGPGNTELYKFENPYFAKIKIESQNIFNTGNWETFSPHWEKRRLQLGLTEKNIYFDLLQPNIFWVGYDVPDTSLFVEMYLKEKYKLEISREKIKSYLDGFSVYKFEEN